MDILTFLYVIDTFLTFLTRCIGYNKIDIIQHIMVRNWAKGTVHIRWHRDNFRDYNYIEKHVSRWKEIQLGFSSHWWLYYCDNHELLWVVIDGSALVYQMSHSPMFNVLLCKYTCLSLAHLSHSNFQSISQLGKLQLLMFFELSNCNAHWIFQHPIVKICPSWQHKLIIYFDLVKQSFNMY